MTLFVEHQDPVSKPYDVFISYRREGGSELAQLLRNALTERGLRVFLDVRELGAGTFDAALLRRVQEAPDFLVILSAGALDRAPAADDWLLREVAHALAEHRNVVPVVTKDFQFPPAESLPPALAELSRHQAAVYDHGFSDASVERLYRMLRSSRTQARRRISRRAGVAAAVLAASLAGALLGAKLATRSAGLTVRYYPNRRAVPGVCEGFAAATQDLAILQTNLTSLLELVDCMKEARHRSPQVRIRVLTLDPASPFIEARGRLIAPDAAVRLREESSGSLQGFVLRARKAHLACEVRLYDEMPTFVLFKADRRIVIAFLTAVGLGRDQPHIELSEDLPGVRDSFGAHFETVWERARPYQE